MASLATHLVLLCLAACVCEIRGGGKYSAAGGRIGDYRLLIGLIVGPIAFIIVCGVIYFVCTMYCCGDTSNKPSGPEDVTLTNTANTNTTRQPLVVHASTSTGVDASTNTAACDNSYNPSYSRHNVAVSDSSYNPSYSRHNVAVSGVPPPSYDTVMKQEDGLP